MSGGLLRFWRIDFTVLTYDYDHLHWSVTRRKLEKYISEICFLCPYLTSCVIQVRSHNRTFRCDFQCFNQWKPDEVKEQVITIIKSIKIPSVGLFIVNVRFLFEEPPEKWELITISWSKYIWDKAIQSCRINDLNKVLPGLSCYWNQLGLHIFFSCRLFVEGENMVPKIVGIFFNFVNFVFCIIQIYRDFFTVATDPPQDTGYIDRLTFCGSLVALTVNCFQSFYSIYSSSMYHMSYFLFVASKYKLQFVLTSFLTKLLTHVQARRFSGPKFPIQIFRPRWQLSRIH